MRLYYWAASWIETLRIAPPFSRRRRELLATLREIEYFEPENWVQVERPPARHELADFHPETGHLHECSANSHPGTCTKECTAYLYCVAQDAEASR